MEVNLNTDNIKAKLKKAWDEQPALVLAAGATALTGVAKIMNANTARKNSKAWRKEVDRRVKSDKKRRAI